MRLHLLPIMLFSGLLCCVPPAAQAGKNPAAAAKSSGYKEIPAFNWGLISTGFVEVFKLRNTEIESAEPNRFFPGSVAFALGKIDDAGHYLMLKCGGGTDCDSRRDALEERLVYATLLEVVRTPKASKDQLYNASTWELTPLGNKYIAILAKRYPDLSKRLARLVGASFASR